MISHQSEAIVLRTWPLHEADLLVTLFTRDQGKIKGVAKAAMKSRRRFGGALEPLTHVRAQYAEKPRQDLMRLDSFEIVSSPLTAPVDYGRAAALAFFAEVLDELLPDHDPQDAVFRLTVTCLAQIHVDRYWLPITYFALWITRLMGWLPELNRCCECGAQLKENGYFAQTRDGLTCALHKRPSSRELTAGSRATAELMMRTPLHGCGDAGWSRSQAADLRRFLLQAMERHLERRLGTAAVLAQL